MELALENLADSELYQLYQLEISSCFKKKNQAIEEFRSMIERTLRERVSKRIEYIISLLESLVESAIASAQYLKKGQQCIILANKDKSKILHITFPLRGTYEYYYEFSLFLSEYQCDAEHPITKQTCDHLIEGGLSKLENRLRNHYLTRSEFKMGINNCYVIVGMKSLGLGNVEGCYDYSILRQSLEYISTYAEGVVDLSDFASIFEQNQIFKAK